MKRNEMQWRNITEVVTGEVNKNNSKHLNSFGWQQHNNVANSLFENRNVCSVVGSHNYFNGQKLTIEHILPTRFDWLHLKKKETKEKDSICNTDRKQWVLFPAVLVSPTLHLTSWGKDQVSYMQRELLAVLCSVTKYLNSAKCRTIFLIRITSDFR